MKIENPIGKKLFPRGEALGVATEIVEALRPYTYTKRLAIAGSLRRLKAEVGDVEIVFVPIISERKAGLFDVEPFDLAEAKIEELLAAGTITKRLNKLGRPTWGPENKYAVHGASGIPVDHFSTTEENFWVTLVIRTGSKETNLRLTCGANKLSRTLNAYGAGITDLKTGEVVRAESEEDVFRLCGVPYLPPHKR